MTPSAAISRPCRSGRIGFSCRRGVRGRRVVMASSVEHREKRVEFRNAHREKLVGTLLPTTSPKTVILCHGFSDHRNSVLMKALATGLDAAELSSFRFDFSGNGDSEGDFQFSNYEKEAEDLRAAIQYLRIAGHEIHGIAGHSKGGGAVLLYAGRYDDVPRVVNISARFKMDRGIAERLGDEALEKLLRGDPIEANRRLPDGSITTYTITHEVRAHITWRPINSAVQDLQTRLNLDVEGAAKKIRRSCVLTVHGTEDTVIPVEDAESFDQCIAQHELCLIEGANHNYTEQKHLQALIDRTVQFLTQP